MRVEASGRRVERRALPRVRSDDVDRARLIDRLPDLESGSRVTLVVAPAGWGKSTLLATWLAGLEAGGGIAYAALSDEDTDLHYFLSRLQSSLVEAVEGMTATSVDDGPTWIDEAARQLEGRSALIVLDDFHLSDDEETSLFLQAALERFPSGCRFVISSRSDPPLSLARLRAEREVEEIRVDELAFEVDEVDRVLRSCFGVELDAGDLRAILEKSEGWPAAVSLAGLSLRQEADPSRFVREFSGTNRVVFEYLSEELLDGLPDELRAFLVETSILEEFSATLCTFLTGRDDAADVLELLMRRSSFLIALDHHGEWFRYHHLVADRLRAELGNGSHRRVLHRRAAEWLAERGRTRSAIRHLLMSDDFEMATELIAEVGVEMVGQGRCRTVLGWIKRLPIPSIRERPELAWQAGLAALFLSDLGEARRWIEILRSCDLTGELRIVATALEANLLNSEGRLEEVLNLAEQIEEAAIPLTSGSQGPVLRPVVAEALVTATIALILAGEPERARRVAHDILRMSDEHAATAQRVYATGVLAHAEWQAGDVAAAERRAHEAARIADAGGLEADAIHRNLGARVEAMVGGDEGRQRANEWLRRYGEIYIPYVNAWSLIIEADVEIRAHNADDAERALSDADDLLDVLPDRSPLIDRLLDDTRARVAERSGHPTAAPDPSALTDRELQILRALAGNLTQREIGRELYLAFNTVKGYVRSAYRKLGVNSRIDAVRRCRELGLI